MRNHRIPRIGCVITTDTRNDLTRSAETSLFMVFSSLVFAVSATATIYFSRSMSSGMDMPGGWTMSMMWMRMPGYTWTASAAMFLLMWLAMMVAMMLPSAMPVLLKSRQALDSERSMNVALAMTVVAIGYFLVWMAIGGAVYVAGVGFALATMRWSEVSRAVPALSGAALVAGCLSSRACSFSSALRSGPGTRWDCPVMRLGSIRYWSSPFGIAFLLSSPPELWRKRCFAATP